MKKLCHFLFCIQHLCIHIVVPWCFMVLQLLDCNLDLLDGDGSKFDVQVLFCLTNVCKSMRVTSVEELLKVFSHLSSLAFSSVMVDPSIALTVRFWFCPLHPCSFPVIRQTVFIYFHSASVANLSTYCLLSLLADVLTSLFFSLY